MGQKILFVGASVSDNVFKMQRNHSKNEYKDQPVKPSLQFGGAAFNASIACARLSQIYGNDVEIGVITKLGGGPRATDARSLMERFGVAVHDAISEQDTHDIPQNVVMVDQQGKRQVHPVWHEYPAMDNAFIAKQSDIIADYDLVHIHTTLPDIATSSTTIAATQNEKGNSARLICVDASRQDDTLDTVLRFATHAALPDELKGGLDNGNAVLDYLADFQNLQRTAVMCGANPTLYRLDVNETLSIKVRVTDAFRLADNLGAGDASRAALMINLATNNSYRIALNHANRVGTYSCHYTGRTWLDELEKNPQDIDRIVGPLVNPNFAIG